MSKDILIFNLPNHVSPSRDTWMINLTLHGEEFFLFRQVISSNGRQVILCKIRQLNLKKNAAAASSLETRNLQSQSQFNTITCSSDLSTYHSGRVTTLLHLKTIATSIIQTHLTAGAFTHYLNTTHLFPLRPRLHSTLTDNNRNSSTAHNHNLKYSQ